MGAFGLLGTGLSRSLEDPDSPYVQIRHRRSTPRVGDSGPDFDDLNISYSGSCPKVKGDKSNFKLSKFEKVTWWLMAIGNSPWETEDYACQSAKYRDSTAHKGNEDNYIIFKTDSKSYAYVWSCFEKGSKYYPMMYILNADRKLSSSDKQDEIDEAMAVMKKTYDWNKDDRKDFAS